jgi:hypothetical protein
LHVLISVKHCPKVSGAEKAGIDCPTSSFVFAGFNDNGTGQVIGAI